MPRRKTNKKFLQEVYELVGEEYEFLEEYVNATTKILCRHNKCGYEWEITPHSFLQGTRCPDCAKRKSNKKFIQEVNSLVGEQYSFLENYIDATTKILCRHNKCGYKWEITPHSFLQGTRCPKCAGNIKKTNLEFINEIKELTGREYVFLKNYINAHTKIPCRHNKCGYVWKISPHDFLNGGHRCPQCNTGGNKKKTNLEFMNEVKELVGIEYTFLEKYIGANIKILCRHNKCGYEWKTKPGRFLWGNRCPKCNSSKGEKKIMRFLKENNFKFEREYSFIELIVKSYLQFDFAVKRNGEILFLIEYDGKQHFDPDNYFHKTEKHFRYRKFKDRVKSAYCFNNSISLLRIPYFRKHQIEYLINEMLEKFDLLESA